MQVGLDFAVRVLLGMGLGALVDVWFGTKPVGVLVGFVLGLGAAGELIWRLWRQGLGND